MRLLTLLLLLLLSATQLKAAEQLGESALGGLLGRTGTITTYILQMESGDNMQKLKDGVITQNDLTQYKISIKGIEYPISLLKMSGHEKVFKDTGGPYLRSLGLNFHRITSPTSVFFYAYTALLIFFISLNWLRMVHETASGKGKFEVIPLILKLAMGLIVAFNLPFVYAIAMTLKDVGVQIVAYAITDDLKNPVTGDRVHITSANPFQLQVQSARNEAITNAAGRALPAMLLPIRALPPPIDPATGKPKDESKFTQAEIDNRARNSGRARLASLVATLNKRILTLHTLPYYTPGKTTRNNRIGPADIDLVGFKSDRNDKQASISPPEDPSLKLTREDATNPSAILANYATNEANANQLASLYIERARKYIDFASLVYTQPGALNGGDPKQPSALFALYMLGVDFTFSSAGKSGMDDGSESAAQASQLALGDRLYKSDYEIFLGNMTSADMRDYKKLTEENAFTWLIGQSGTGGLTTGTEMENTLPDDLKGENTWYGKAIAAAGNLASKLATGVSDMLVDFVYWIANLFMSIVRMVWIPTLAFLATYVFNFTVECYVYILWLAYPFWFYKKTEKAFTGALETLINASFTMMAFGLLVYIFEMFAANVVNTLMTMARLNIDINQAASAGAASGMAGGGVAGAALEIGKTAGVGLAAIGVVTFSPIAVGAIIGIGIGYSVFYIVGSFLCFRLAPKIFQAFREGSSVVAPMLAAAATAAISGVAGALLGGTMVGGAVAAAKGLAGQSKALAAAGRKIGQWSKSAQDKINQTPGIGSVSRGVGYAARAPGRLLRGIGRGLASAGRGAASAVGLGDVATGVGEDIRAATGNIREKINDVASNPMSALGRLAQSKFAQLAIVTASGFTGDPSAPLKNLGGQILATETLSRLGGQQAAQTPSRSDKDLSPVMRQYVESRSTLTGSGLDGTNGGNGGTPPGGGGGGGGGGGSPSPTNTPTVNVNVPAPVVNVTTPAPTVNVNIEAQPMGNPLGSSIISAPGFSGTVSPSTAGVGGGNGGNNGGGTEGGGNPPPNRPRTPGRPPPDDENRRPTRTP